MPGATRPEVKICGLRTPDMMAAAAQAGADYIGLVFYPPSPRYVDVTLAADLTRSTPPTLKLVGLFVDATDEEISHYCAALPLDYLQLHGHESPERLAEIRTLTDLPLIKALRIGESADLMQIGLYKEVADMILLDAKPPRGVSSLPGGTGLYFDWQILQDQEIDLPWMLSGGLDAGNVRQARRITGATRLDVSSGVEDRPGVKSAEKIKAFIAAARQTE